VLAKLKESGWLGTLFDKYGLRAFPGEMKPTTGVIEVAPQ